MKYGKRNSIPKRTPKRIRNKDQRVLAEQVFEVLQQSIVNGELRANQRLVESEIAKKLGTSRTPVREALKRLEITGYASTRPGGGLIVADHSMQVQSLFEIREALECMAVRLSCSHITEEQIRKAEDYYTRSTEAIRNEDTEQYVKLHRAFHEELYSACGNDRLKSLISTFRYQYHDKQLARMYTSREWHGQIKYHGQILEAVRERNARRTEKLLRRHLRNSLKIALRRL